MYIPKGIENKDTKQIFVHLFTAAKVKQPCTDGQINNRNVQYTCNGVYSTQKEILTYAVLWDPCEGCRSKPKSQYKWTHTVRFHLYETPKSNSLAETDNMVIPGGWGKG